MAVPKEKRAITGRPQGRGIDIHKLEKQYKAEWLLIRVTQSDKEDNPIEGELLAHSKDRETIYELQKTLGGDLYITYTGTFPKKGFATLFRG